MQKIDYYIRERQYVIYLLHLFYIGISAYLVFKATPI